jgi:hypothetical protein
MNYSLFIMVTKEMVSMEVKGQQGMALAASPLLSSQSLDPFLGISSLCAALP